LLEAYAGPERLTVFDHKKLNTMSTFTELLQSDRPVLVDFFAEWCGPCKLMAPILKEVKNAMGDDVMILKLDVDKNPHVADAFQVQGVPTLIIFFKGEIKWRQSGVIPAAQLEQVLRQFVPESMG
jgi:thioredoxin 1